MGPAEIIIIVAAVAIVVGAIIVYAVRKAKGKPAGGSGCGCCPYANQCSRNSSSKKVESDSCVCGDGKDGKPLKSDSRNKIV